MLYGTHSNNNNNNFIDPYTCLWGSLDCTSPWGPFLERPGHFTGPKSDFEIKISRKVGCVLNSNKVHFVSLANNFTA